MGRMKERNFVAIKSLENAKEMGEYLCTYLMKEDCDHCPVKNKCKIGTNGIYEWLWEEAYACD